MEKLIEFSVLNGKKILSVHADKHFIHFYLENGPYCEIQLDDDGPMNDSHAFFSGFEALNQLRNKTVKSAEVVEINKDNAEFKMVFDDGTHYEFESLHEHNGYYGYRYYIYYSSVDKQ
jgi:hypothetical protein